MTTTVAGSDLPVQSRPPMPNPLLEGKARADRQCAAFARRLRAWREQREVSVAQLAFFGGVSDDTVRNYEAGKTHPTLWVASMFAWGLDISLQDLLFEDPPKH